MHLRVHVCAGHAARLGPRGLLHFICRILGGIGHGKTQGRRETKADLPHGEGAEYTKRLGTDNPADLMTKDLARDNIGKYMPSIGQCFHTGRAKSGLEMQKVGTA